MSLTGTGPLPLGTGPGGTYALVQSQIDITLDPTKQSTGKASLFQVDGDPAIHHGDLLRVDSFFDVFFIATITDIDPSATYATGLPNPIMMPGMAHMQLGGDTQGNLCTADIFQPNYGCLPPVGDIYIGHFQIVVPTGVDINGDGTDDIVKFTLAAHSVGGVTQTFISGTQVIDTFNSTSTIDGGVQNMGDDLSDPPFTVGLSGPTTASQNIVVAAVPEPATFLLFGAGLGLLGLSQLRKKGARAK